MDKEFICFVELLSCNANRGTNLSNVYYWLKHLDAVSCRVFDMLPLSHLSTMLGLPRGHRSASEACRPFFIFYLSGDAYCSGATILQSTD